MRVRTLIALIPALALASCGSSSSSTSSPAVTRATSTTTITTTTTSSSSTSAMATSTSPRVASRGTHCRASQLTLTFLGQQGATGHGELGFRLHNRSGVRCTSFGYPGVLFLGRSGQPLPTVPTHTTHDFFGHAPLTDVVLAPGHSASFRLGVTHGAASTAGCTTAHGLQVIPPNDTATLRVTIPDGAYECRTVTVSPVRPGTSAYP